MLCAPHGNNVGAVVHPHHLPPPSTPTIPPNSPLVATFVVWLQALDFRPQKLRLSSLLSVRQRVFAAQQCMGVCVGARAYVVGVRVCVCVRAINLSLVIIVLIVSLAFGFNVRSAFMYCICCPAHRLPS